MISYCTTCMNRLKFLSQTLPRNIEAVAGSGSEFVVLDYGGTKGLEDWARRSLADAIASGTLRLFRTRQPRTWFAPHAKNVAHLCARGDILANIDADVYIPDGFTEYLERLLAWPAIIQMRGLDIHENAGTGGVVILRAEHFHSVRGYDESLARGWTCEDLHLQFRARMANGLELLDTETVCTVIPHDNDLRFMNTASRGNTYDQAYGDLVQRYADGRWVSNDGVPWGVATDLELMTEDGWVPHKTERPAKP